MLPAIAGTTDRSGKTQKAGCTEVDQQIEFRTTRVPIHGLKFPVELAEIRFMYFRLKTISRDPTNSANMQQTLRR